MKKIFTLILIVSALTSGYVSKATHLMGGEMTVEHLGGNTHVIHFQAYRDTIGIPFAMTAEFKIYDNSYNLLLTTSVSQLPSSGGLMPGYPYGVETYFFHDTIVVPGPGVYHVEWSNCCRNAAIINLDDPLGDNMFLSTTFTNYTGSTNSTPEFLAPPITFLPINQPWQYNSLPYDVDGDSLAWSIDTPLTGRNNFCDGWLTPSSASAAGAFTIDPITGQIDWTPNVLGNFVASILVEEFRNGIKIGEIRRDYQMIVIPDKNKSPEIVNFGDIPVNADGYPFLRVSALDEISLKLNAEDENGDQVEFIAYGEPFLHTSNPASFTTVPYNGTGVSGTFSWTPKLSQVNNKPYVLVFRVRDQIFTKDHSVLLHVDRTIMPTPVLSDNFGSMWPNPVTDEVALPIQLTQTAQVTVSIIGISGALVAEKDFGTLTKGEHNQSMPINLSAGTYFVRLIVNGKIADTQRMIVGQQ